MSDDPQVMLFAAYVKAQAEMPRVGKGRSAKLELKSGGSYSYNFADLSDVIDALRPVLSKHGLAYFQSVEPLQPNLIGVTTVVVHEAGGKFTAGPFPMPASGDARAYGSAVTYGKRYALCATFGIATEDDDGASAAKPAPQARKAPANPAAEALMARIKATKDTPLAETLRAFAAAAGLEIKASTIAADPKFAEQLETILKENGK